LTRTFVDTSAILALLVKNDGAHDRARATFDRLRARNVALLTTSYVLVELYALAARRLGRDAVKTIRSHFAPLLDVVWVDGELHERALDLLLERTHAGFSLVDAASLLTIRDRRIEDVFAYDRHFEAEGFSLL
jgi:predicted nucleic acid-binding protein